MSESNVLGDAVALFQQGNNAGAERVCREQLAQAPDDEGFLFLLSMALQRQERFADALDGYARLTELSPQTAAYWTNYATALRLAGRSNEAEPFAAKAVELAPTEAVFYTALGQVQLANGDHANAQANLLKACELDPASPEAHLYAAHALIAVRDAQAYTLLKNWRAWLPLDPPDQVLLAHLLMTIGDAGDAHEVLVELTRRAPMYLPARLQLGNLYERKNQLDMAEALLADTTARFPAMDVPARLETAHLRATLAMRSGHLDDARALLESAGPRTRIDYAHYFLLADVVDKLGDTSAAMESLAIAHALQVEELTPMAPQRFAAGSVVLPNAVARLDEAGYRAWPPLTAPDAAQSPIFIVGFPRSGTTLLEQMLDAHPKLQSMDERPFFTILGNELGEYGVRMPHDIGRLNQRDCDELRKRYYALVAEKIRRRWDARLVDKNPLNMLWVPLIQRLFPQARFILALRHPCDVVLSNYMQNYRSSVLASACSTLQRTAEAYVAAMESWLYHVTLIKPKVMVSRYEELVADFPRQVERIAAFLGLEDASPMLAYDKRAREKGFIATPSYTEVIQPVSTKRMDRWRRYQKEFEPLLPILKPMLAHWGYST